MNNDQNKQPESQAPIVTFSNIPLDDPAPTPVFPDPAELAASEPQEIPEIEVVDVQFKKGGKVYYFDPKGLELTTGDEVIIETARGPEYAFCAGGNHQVPKTLVVSPLRSVIRKATDQDRQTRQSFKDKEAEAFALCQEKILEHKLDMKLVSAEYSFDGSKLLFNFTADGRVDFRDLVKNLAGVFRTRIELRQIGVRDEAKLLGGLGICGRPFCCRQFLDDFQPVSIKMAKTQGLSLNPTKISGTCGRLMCCLKYEQDAYESLIKSSPKSDSLVNTYDGVGTVTDVNILKQTVKVRLEQDPSKQVTYPNCEVCVLRNGKARKNDPPIDTAIPPLPRPEKQQEQPEEITMFDESTLSNYTAGDAAKAAERAARSERRRAAALAEIGGEWLGDDKDKQKPSRSQGQNRNRNRNRNRSKGQNQEQTRAGDKITTRPLETKKQTQEGTGQKPAGEKKDNRNKRRYYRGGGKKTGGQKQS